MPFNHFGDLLPQLSQALGVLVTEAHHATEQLDLHIKDAHLAHDKQLETQKSVNQLSVVVTELTHFVQSEIENINSTVALVTDHMLRNTQLPSTSEFLSHMSAVATWLWGFVLRGK